MSLEDGKGFKSVGDWCHAVINEPVTDEWWLLKRIWPRGDVEAFIRECEGMGLLQGFIYRNGRGRAARYRTWKKLKDEL